MIGSTDRYRVRAARQKEAEALTALALRSKAYWGYSEAFMAACRDELTLTPEGIAQGEVFVLEDAREARILGTFSLESLEPEEPGAVELCLFFLDPDAIGRGLGRRMFEEMIARSRAEGFRRLVVQSDPHAESFYRAVGCVRTGTLPSLSIPGRVLPLLEMDLAAG